MLNNFIYAQSKAMFEERLHEVPNDAIVFIEDTKEIWNHGHYFAGEHIDPEIISNLLTTVARLESEKVDENTVDAKIAALVDSASSLTVASATKLQTARSLWGQSFDGTADVNGDLISTGKIVGQTGIFDTSDETLKDFHGDIIVDFDAIKSIPKKYFTWKDGDGKVEIGTGAQSLQKIYPELVEESNGTLVVAYNKLAIVALAAIDKLNDEKKALEERVEKLEKLVEKLV